MLTDSQTRWTDDRIQALVTPQFVLEQFRPDKRELLKRPGSFGDGATDNTTYLDWIIHRAKRLFLILEHISAPEHILSLVDESYEDNDLPITAQAVKDLKLSTGPDTSLDKKFYRAQFIYLVRDIREGDHKHFLDDETVPIRLVGSTNAITRSGKDAIEKVHLAPNLGRVYGRRKVILNQPPNHVTEANILSEIDAAKRLANEHVLSVYASYSHSNNLYILLRPAFETTLHSFTSSTPKHFENLPKPQRREILLNWPHCLANGLAWLHTNGRHHGALRPSNVLIDSEYRIYLGQVDGLNITHSNIKVSELESYQYAAPERWKRAVTMQKKAPASVALHSGGRTSRKQSLGKSTPATGTADDHEGWASGQTPMSPRLPIDTSKPTSTAYPFIPSSKVTSSRGQHRRAESAEYAASIFSSSSSGTGQRRSDSVRISGNPSDRPSRSRTGPASRSIVSSHGSDGRPHANPMPNSITVAPSEIRTTVVQTWQSAQLDSYAADVFSLGAVMVDIITFLSKRSSSAFAKHRQAKNRTGGRGGGVLDASFHANLGQVYSWTVSLEEEANKKATKEDSKIFQAVGPVLDVARGCLARGAEERPGAHSIEKLLESCLQQFTSSGMAHCKLQAPSRGEVDTAGFMRPSGSGMPKTSAAAMSMAAKETGIRSGNYDQRNLSARQGKARVDAEAMKHQHRVHNSLALFNFDYGQENESSHRGTDSDDESASRETMSSGLSADEIISLQSIADRPDRLRDGTDISGWSHMHTDARASYVSSDTHTNSISSIEELELMNNFFLPKSGPPSSLPTLPSSTTSSEQSLNQFNLSNTARKRVVPDPLRIRRKESTQEPSSHRGQAIDLDALGEGGFYASTQPSTHKPYNEMIGGADYPSGDNGSLTSTDSTHHRDSDLSTSELSRGRNSVSTLASNSSTIRLSWQHRDVSPLSVRDGTPSTRTSVSTSGQFSDDNDTDGQDDDPRESPRYTREREQRSAESSRKLEMARAERVYRNLQRSEVVIGGGGGDKGKTKAENTVTTTTGSKTGSKKGGKSGMYSRFSILGGMM